MATRVIDDTKLNDIAVAIQAKDSGGQMTVDEMPTRIDALPTGGTLIPKTITENGVYNATDDNADGYDVVTVSVPEKNTLDEHFANTLEVANIPSATSIANNLFEQKTNLIDVIMPNVVSIGRCAFLNCTNLALTALPDGITSISNGAFQNCTNLALTALPDGITSIGEYTFAGCTNLALIALPDGITSIGRYAFQNCTNLALTALPDGITSISNGAFLNCTNLALTALPDGITSISEYTFAGCTNLALIALPDGITSIGTRAFKDCTSLYSIDLTAFTDPQAIPTLANANAFQNIPATAQFIVANQEMYDVFTTATNWSTYASKFVIEGA